MRLLKWLAIYMLGCKQGSLQGLKLSWDCVVSYVIRQVRTQKGQGCHCPQSFNSNVWKYLHPLPLIKDKLSYFFSLKQPVFIALINAKTCKRQLLFTQAREKKVYFCTYTFFTNIMCSRMPRNHVTQQKFKHILHKKFLIHSKFRYVYGPVWKYTSWHDYPLK